MAKTAHDTFEDHQEVQGPSDRAFGLTVGGILLAIMLVRLLAFEAGTTSTLVLGVPGALLVLLGIVWPSSLHLLNVAWAKLGLLLASIVNPLIMGLIYLFLFVPIGLGMKLFGRDALRMKRPAANESYWISRTPSDPDARSMENQF
ncbi:SxtJ family membrane protein [Aurantiacibacter hainanensis]|uniref:SxtJ family membrane protein n=1 Tax=Aurantiacibacter hainanensis TaxID=3076114 RepID=UPI0030C71B2D